jgi:hypothetical protein
MADKKSQESRRKLLKSIAAGSGAIVAGKSLPENWKRPVVDSVMLPAHAQTSPPTSPPPTSPPPTCTLPQTIPSASVDCSQGVGFNEFRYYAIRTANAPCGFQVIASSTPLPEPYIEIVIRVDGQIGADIFIASNDSVTDDFAGGTSSCPDGTTSDVLPLPIAAYDETSAEYTVTGTITATAGTVSMSQLTITPV